MNPSDGPTMSKTPRKFACKPNILVLAVMLVLLVGWVDYITNEVPLFTLYALPIAISVWWCGEVTGALVVLLCFVVCLYANLDFFPFKNPLHLTFVWGEIFVFFLTVGFASSLARRKQASDKIVIEMLKDRNQLENDLVAISEYEKKRFGRELHDGLCQQLSAINCATTILLEELSSKGTDIQGEVTLVHEFIRMAMIDARCLATGISPIFLEESGLTSSIKQLGLVMAPTSSAVIKMDLDEVNITDQEISLQLYRIIQEAISNSLRHAGAENLFISMKIRGDKLTVVIRDDGKGLPDGLRCQKGGMGLRSMEYRARSIGALYDISSNPGQGTFITVDVSLNNPSPIAATPLGK